MSSAKLVLGWAAAWLVAGPTLGQPPPGTLQGGTYNAPAGAGAYTPANPALYPVAPAYPPVVRSPRDILNRDILNPGAWAGMSRRPLQNGGDARPKPGRDQGNTALIRVEVPTPDTELWVNGRRTKQTGLRRVFISPPLEPGTYRYVFRASWAGNRARGGAEEPVTFQPGVDLTIDFSARR